jgi:hypothetical protein
LQYKLGIILNMQTGTGRNRPSLTTQDEVLKVTRNEEKKRDGRRGVSGLKNDISCTVCCFLACAFVPLSTRLCADVYESTSPLPSVRQTMQPLPGSACRPGRSYVGAMPPGRPGTDRTTARCRRGRPTGRRRDAAGVDQPDDGAMPPGSTGDGPDGGAMPPGSTGKRQKAFLITG